MCNARLQSKFALSTVTPLVSSTDKCPNLKVIQSILTLEREPITENGGRRDKRKVKTNHAMDQIFPGLCFTRTEVTSPCILFYATAHEIFSM